MPTSTPLAVRDPRESSLAWAEWRVTAGVTGGIAFFFALSLVAVLVVTGGTFGYVLDDPYIHLSMAEQILRGEYGINPGEPAAAASSILYPYLLAALTALGFGSFGPIVVNAVALAATVICLATILDDHLGPPHPGRTGRRVCLILALCLPLNLVGLAFTGMENGVHVALSLFGLLGISRFLRDARPPLWWLAVLVVAPLVRYEGFSLVLAGVVILALNRRPALALAVLAAALVGPACFSFYLHSLGLPLLPASVLVKGAEAGIAGSSDLFTALTINLSRNVLTPDGLLTTACLAFLLLRLVRMRPERPHQIDPTWQMAFAGAIILAAQLAVGRFPSFGDRYSIYALALGTATILIIYARPAKRFLEDVPTTRLVRIVGLASLAATIFWQALSTGISAGNIYFQQYQTHRFIADFWRRPIAANDVGWPSYLNDVYVLDLWGLGSEKARRARSRPDAAEALGALVEERQIEAAVIYDDWFPSRPAAWVPVARMRLDIPLTSAASDVVTFYATDQRFAPGLKEKLAAFGATLPKGASLRLE